MFDDYHEMLMFGRPCVQPAAVCLHAQTSTQAVRYLPSPQVHAEHALYSRLQHPDQLP
jgi:hypothetical protein